jgi:hypothetical protein
MLIIIIYRKRGNTFVFYVPKKSISLNHTWFFLAQTKARLICLFMFLIFFKRNNTIQLIVVGVNHLVMVLKQFVLFFQMLYLSIFFIDLLF